MVALAFAPMPSRAGSPADGANIPALKRAVIENYASLASAAFRDSLAGAKELKSAVDSLLAKPSEEALEAARRAWLSAHQAYSFTEAFRFYNGPIDQVEGFVNSWPIDASYIDSVADMPDSGIVNAVSDHPAITRELVISLNAKEGKQNISTGFHAIEFLLWGQPQNGRGAGKRSWRDYSYDGKNAPRRREYLKIVTDLLVEHLQDVVGAWSDRETDNYRAKFLAMEPDAALANILMGMGALSGPELSGERLTTAYETKERAEQQSCFSNSTCDDLIANATGIQNVFLGRHQSPDGKVIEGSSVFSLLQKLNPEFAGKMSGQITGSVAAVRAIPPPFDQAILGTNESPSRMAMKKAITSLQAQSDMVAEAASVLSIKLKL